MLRKILAIPLLVVMLLAACGEGTNGSGSGDGDSGSSGAIAHPTGSDELILRVDVGGGFVPVEYHLRNVPGVSIYGDGRMIVTGPVIEIYPGPALPNLQVTRLTEDGVQAILAEAEAAGLLGGDASYEYPCVTDLPTTTFTVNADGATNTVAAYALGFESSSDTGGADGCPNVDRESRDRLLAFSTKLGDLRSWLPAGSFGDEEPYAPSELRIYVTRHRDDPDVPQRPIAWPLGSRLAEAGEPDPNLPEVRCLTVSGPDLEAVLELAQGANELSPWVSEDRRFGLVFRPLLPDEHGC